MKTWMTFALLALFAALPAAQESPGARVPPLTPDAQRAVVRELSALVSLPNVATNQADIRRNADYLVEAFSRRGFKMQVVETAQSPVVLGERPGAAAPGTARPLTLAFYCHYDGQPVVDAEWRDGGPFTPVLRDAPPERGGKVVGLPSSGPLNPEWRLYARSSSDPRLRVIFEGDEEAGSPVLEDALRDHAAAVASDLVIMMDGPRHLSGRPTFFFGARGILSAELTVFGARRDLHSGNYGNWAPNPALALARLLSSMKDDGGRVGIPGFYDDVVPLTPAEKQAIAEIPAVEAAQMRELGFARPEVPGSRIEERHNLPTLNVSGLGAGTVEGQGRTIIPARASARLDLRMVHAIDPGKQFARLEAHVRAQGFHLVAGDTPSDAERLSSPKLARLVKFEGYPAGRTPIDEPTARRVIEAVAAGAGKAPVRYPTLGGSAPFYIFSARLGLPTIGMPVVNYDNNQHGPNENIQLGALFDAVQAVRAILSM